MTPSPPLPHTKELSLRLGGDRDLVSPDGDERRIAAIVAAVDTVIHRCEQTAQTISRSLLCRLRNVRP